MAKKAKKRAATMKKPPPAKRKSAAATAAPHRRPAYIPVRQWQLPAGVLRDGRLASLRQVLDPKTPTLDGRHLTDQQRVEIALARMRKQEHFAVGVLGVGVVDKEQALAQMAARTRLGLALIEIEHRAIRLIRERAKAEARKATRERTRRGPRRRPAGRVVPAKKRRRVR
jgi:hypothetical protein